MNPLATHLEVTQLDDRTSATLTFTIKNLQPTDDVLELRAAAIPAVFLLCQGLLLQLQMQRSVASAALQKAAVK